MSAEVLGNYFHFTQKGKVSKQGCIEQPSGICDGDLLAYTGDTLRLEWFLMLNRYFGYFIELEDVGSPINGRYNRIVRLHNCVPTSCMNMRLDIIVSNRDYLKAAAIRKILDKPLFYLYPPKDKPEDAERLEDLRQNIDIVWFNPEFLKERNL